MTDVDISDLLSQLKTTASKLNRESDAVAAIIASVEADLVAMKVGLETWLEEAPLEEDTDTEDVETPKGDFVTKRTTHQTELGFARVGGEWCLAVRVEKVADYPDYPTDPAEWSHETVPSRLADASRELRIEALRHLPALLKAINQRAERALEAIEHAKKLAPQPPRLVNGGLNIKIPIGQLKPGTRLDK